MFHVRLTCEQCSRRVATVRPCVHTQSLKGAPLTTTDSCNQGSELDEGDTSIRPFVVSHLPLELVRLPAHVFESLG